MSEAIRPAGPFLAGRKARLPALAALLFLAGCVSAPRPAPPTSIPVPAPRTYSVAGLEAVMGANAAAIVSRFGPPDQELREGPAQKLQYLGPACVLDIYLYPGRGGGDPVATHVDARLPDGREMDRSSCVAALLARR